MVIATPVASAAAGVQNVGREISADPDIARYLSIAHTYWGKQPGCPAQVFEADLDLDALAYGEMPGCNMWLDRKLIYRERRWISQLGTDGLLCGVIVHEYGHLIGFAHSDDPASPMFASSGHRVTIAPPCKPAPAAAVRTPTARHVRRQQTRSGRRCSKRVRCSPARRSR